jgi:quercetin dioxygenase-like cupin family protein
MADSVLNCSIKQRKQTDADFWSVFTIEGGGDLMHPQKRGLFNPVIRTTDEPMLAVIGILLQFVSTPDQNGRNLSVMRGGIPPRAVIPLHSHPDAEIFYVTEGTMEIYQDDGISSGWQTAGAGEVVTIAGGVKHALRNLGSTMVMAVLVSEQQLYDFFRELAEPLDPNAVPAAPKPEVMQRLFELAARYQYWIGSPSENAAIGINLG